MFRGSIGLALACNIARHKTASSVYSICTLILGETQHEGVVVIYVYNRYRHIGCHKYSLTINTPILRGSGCQTQYACTRRQNTQYEYDIVSATRKHPIVNVYIYRSNMNTSSSLYIYIYIYIYGFITSFQLSVVCMYRCDPKYKYEYDYWPRRSLLQSASNIATLHKSISVTPNHQKTLVFSNSQAYCSLKHIVV